MTMKRSPLGRRVAEDPRPPRPAVAGHARSLPHLAVGDHAAADAGRGGHSLLRAFPRALSGHREPGGRHRRRGARAVERPGLLRARAQSAPRRAGDRRTTRRRVPARLRRHRRVAGHRPLDGGRHCRVRVRARQPILDGNVKRVFARAFGIAGFPGEKKIESAMWRARSKSCRKRISKRTRRG